MILQRAVAVAFLLGSCRTVPSVTASEAKSFLAAQNAIALSPVEERLRLLALSCAKSSACAELCSDALERYGTARFRERRDALVGCDAYQRYAQTFADPTRAEIADEFVHVRVRAFAALIERAGFGANQVSRVDRLLAGERVDLD